MATSTTNVPRRISVWKLSSAGFIGGTLPRPEAPRNRGLIGSASPGCSSALRKAKPARPSQTLSWRYSPNCDRSTDGRPEKGLSSAVTDNHDNRRAKFTKRARCSEGDYTGRTVVNAGTLLLEGAGNHVPDTSAVTLAGGTLAMGGLTETVGTLTLSGGSSVIDLGTGTSFRTFADSCGVAWTGTLSIWNWSGAWGGGGTDPP